MRQGPLYLKSSIFYSANSWPTLIAKGLKPFVNKYPNSPCTLRLNDEQGENVRFALATSNQDFERIAAELHQHLQDFLQIHPSQAGGEPCTQSLFIDFPTNAVRYDLFDHIPFLFEYRDKVLDIDEFLAEFWRLVISTEAPVLEQLFRNRYVFSVQLFLTLLFCFSKDTKHAHAIINHVRNTLRDKELSLTEELENKYLAQLSNFQPLVKETWKMLGAKESDNYYLLPFKKIFLKFATSAKTLREDQRLLLFYQVIKRLNNDLGIVDDTLIMYYVKMMEQSPLTED